MEGAGGLPVCRVFGVSLVVFVFGMSLAVIGQWKWVSQCVGDWRELGSDW